MSREHALVNMGIWQDDDWRAVPPPAQHLYLTLWTHPGLSYCGVLDWRPKRLTALSCGWTSEAIVLAADCLRARHFIVTDDDTEECFIRSWARWDGLMKQPRMAVSFANAYSTVASNLIRKAIIHELIQLHERQPELAGFAKSQVQTMLDLPAVSAKVSVSISDPFGDGFTHRFGPSLGQTLPKVSPKVSVSPTPSTATATNSITTSASRTPLQVVAPDGDTAQTIVAEWIDGQRSRPPGAVVGQVAKQVGAMLAEGISADDVRDGLTAWQRKKLHPSTLPSVVHEMRTAAEAPSEGWFPGA